VWGRSLMVSFVLGALGLVAAPSAMADEPVTGGLVAPGAEPTVPGAEPTVPGEQAEVREGIAHAPEAAPEAVKEAIWAANAIIGRPYRYGGGHGRGFVDRGYDCSGTVSYALHGAGLIGRPRDSSSFMSWGESGRGDWITVYTNPGHAYVVIAGLRLDTSAAGDPSGDRGPRWRPTLRSSRGFKARHPEGL
jgi:cell wall-associated NlpC family hydrolase